MVSNSAIICFVLNVKTMI